MLIGLTGQIGAGKTTAAVMLASMGAYVIDADLIGHEVVDSSPQLRRKLGHQFGPDIFDWRGRLKRRLLARRAFANEESRRLLNNLVHPYLLKELHRQVRVAARSYNLVIIDAALLLDWHMDREVDFVLVIHASRNTRFARLARRGISRADAMARQKAQLPFREYQRRADRLILNNVTPANLKTKLMKFLNSIKPKSR